MMQLASISDNLKVWKFQQETSSTTTSTTTTTNNEKSNSIPLVNSTLQLQTTFQHTTPNFYSFAWNHTNQVIALGGREPKIHLVQSNNGHLLSSLTLSESEFKSMKIQAIDFSYNSRYLITSVHTPIQLWDLKTRKIKSVFVGHQYSIISLLFHPIIHEFFYSADELGQIWIWDSKTQNIKHKFIDLTASLDQNRPDNNYLTCMKLSSSGGNYLASGYVDGSVKIWDATVNDEGDHAIIRKQRLHSEKITGLAFSPRNPNIFVSVGFDEQLQLLDIHSKPTETNLSVDVNQRLTSVSFHENGINCAVGTSEGNILMYDFRNTRYPIVQVPAHNPHSVNLVAFQLPVDATRSSTLTARIEKKQKSPDTKENNSGNEEQKELNGKKSSNRIMSNVSFAPEIARHESGLKPPILVTSIDLSDHHQPRTAGKGADPILVSTTTNYTSHASSLQTTISTAVDSKIKNFESSLKTRLHNGGSALPNEDLSNTSILSGKHSNYDTNLPPVPPLQKPSLYASPQQIQNTLKEIYPPPSQKSLFKSPPHDKEAEVATNSKAQSQTVLNHEDDVQAIDDPTTQTYEQREKDYKQHFDKYYERNEIQQQSAMHFQPSLTNAAPVADADIYNVHDDFASLRQAIRPVSVKELEESLDLLRYDIHCEIQEIIHEQVRQFNIAKEETSSMIQELAKQLQGLVELNKELREENNYLRKIY